MSRDIKPYFEDVVLPLIATRMPHLVDQMTIQVLGSYGLGIADQHSDLDSAIYLDNTIWQQHGGQLQLLLETELPRFGKDVGHPDICVWPIKWLGNLLAFLDPQTEAPWEQVTVEDLHKVQENLLLRDPQEVFARLRQATHPDRHPNWLWRKRLLIELHKAQDMIPEYRQCVLRNKTLSASIRLGAIIESLLHIGFYIHKRYHPWPTHLRWAFEKLPPPMDEALRGLESILATPHGHDTFVAIERVWHIYARCITDRGLLPTVNLLGSERHLAEELTWANRLQAWSNPNYKETLGKAQLKAHRASHPDHWWIWTLWSME